LRRGRDKEEAGEEKKPRREKQKEKREKFTKGKSSKSFIKS